MKLFSFLLILISTTAMATADLSTYHAPEDLKNIYVQPLGSNKHSSEFIIFIRDEVKPHYHQHHTELIYVIEGEAVLNLNSTKQIIKPGDFIKIEEGNVHSVSVTSPIPLKVLSVQTPEFFGKDRVYIAEEGKSNDK